MNYSYYNLTEILEIRHCVRSRLTGHCTDWGLKRYSYVSNILHLVIYIKRLKTIFLEDNERLQCIYYKTYI